ncbi:P-type ATPase, translocating [Methanomethylovorans hollandica DSM 15978]|uniref:P-type ATPase, translocating n=1 Tax=Methanomethylovorans hollandica (strain DSM 15978 / NBRC 107637 / DMS1) TaxID=867904 RepID=L0KZQ2_METHD|nr:HAD-IC family P-type ATPase [Methanomethylovorans hollandica]AGB49578.1 P-type ATPase, translocating [Methanomethylovorans hollandica DSM 15978]
MINTVKGLTKEEAQKRLREYGPNSLPVPRHRFLKLILRQFKGIFNLLLIAAAVVTYLLGEPIDAAFILFFVFMGTALNVYQEYKSNAAADKLKSYLRSTITVIRDGEDQEVSTDQIVPGDVLNLESGDIVPADCIVREVRSLQVDETTFTGESIPVIKQAVLSDDQTITDENRLLQGIVIVSGNALAEVTATGINTKLAGIAKTASEVQAESELVKGIDRISKFILKTTLITLLFIVLANAFIEGKDTDFPQLLIFAIALAVSVIPEALPLVLTFALSNGALQFAKRKVVVKRLTSVQDLGSVNLLCTDKTGTITENQLRLTNAFKMPSSPYHPLILSRLAAIGLKERIPEPFDRASDESLSPEQRKEVDEYKIITQEAFDPAVRSNGAVVIHTDGTQLHIRRGSPEYFDTQGLIDDQIIGSWLEDEEKLGHRVLGVSYDDGNGAKFGGFVSFVDKLKATTVETVKMAKRLNVAITIITGDALIVAQAIGREAGLVSDNSEVITASDFLSLPSTEQYKKMGSIRVFARTTPQQKLELIKLLKAQFTVGFLGEGINDAPALKAADVSMVVQSASDVSRETADIILLENDLRVIVDGIRLGRETHANTLKYIRATLVSNFGNFYAVAVGSLLISFLPMLPKQLLLLNLLSDFPMMAIAFDKVSEKEIEYPQKYDFRSMYIIFVTLGLVSTVFDFMYFGLFYRISPAVLQTNWYIGSVLTELLLMFSIRSMLPIGKAGKPAPLIILLSIAAVVLTIALPIIPATAKFFEFITPTPVHLGLIVSLAVIYFVVTELVKRPLAKYFDRINNESVSKL